MKNLERLQAKSLVLFAAILILVSGCQPGSQASSNQPASSTPVNRQATSSALVETPSTLQVSNTAPQPTPPPLADGGFASAIKQVAERVKPAIVQITNEQTQYSLFSAPFTVPAGVGSGIIYDTEGHILTNNHVVAGAQKLIVSLPDGRSFPGKLIGGDPRTDLAVVQIKGNNLPVAELGDSNQLQVGDWVVAIGNALALPGGPTVTAGVVSALNRNIQEPSSGSGSSGPFLFNVIQTSAPINPGNSGGALVSLSGQVIGINTLIATQAGPGVQAQGIGFAIAISTAKPIADQLVATGKVVHTYLGINYIPLSPGIAAQLGVQETHGVVIINVASGSPADTAGLRPKDVITAVDGKALKTESALAEIEHSHKPGDKLSLTVIRGSQTLHIEVTLGATS
ncbi:MAG: trypsin-like peptidase domain-containing protein [Anaerolineales bacterium]